jgi:altronate dehydratase small subunit
VKRKTIMMKPQDKVATALEDIEAGSAVTVQCKNQIFTIEVKHTIQFGHKFAMTSIKKGEDILKYGEVIGRANRNIDEGEHVHVHNLEGTRGRGDKVGTE